MRRCAPLAFGVLLLAQGCSGSDNPKDAPRQTLPSDAGVQSSEANTELGPTTNDAGLANSEPTSTKPSPVAGPPSDAGSEQPSPTSLGTDDAGTSATVPTSVEPPPPAACEDSVEPGGSPLRRLSRVEYGNTLFQLFGDVSYQRLGVDQLVADGEALGFSNQASVLSTSPLLASQYLDIATRVADEHADDFDTALQTCTDGALSSDCQADLDTWLDSFGQLVYRRPLTSDEVADYAEIYTWEVSAHGEHREGVRRVLETFLQSPHFLYRPEFGDQEDVSSGVKRVSSWEMATRLSYLFWNTMPDVGLFEAAAADELRTPKQIEAAAKRLLKAPRARLAFRNFHTEWLNLADILNVRHNGKDEELFPDYDDTIPPELMEETLQFLDYAVFDGEGTLSTLLTAPFTRVNQHSAAFYGLDGPKSDAYETVQLDPERYSGFLTQAGLLMAHSTRDLSSPIHRGLFIRTNLLCQPPPPPPPNIPPPPKVDRTKTTREQYKEHDDNPTCAACHKLMDPIGLGFEHFDAMGRYRDTEWDQAIDASGVIYQNDPDQGWVAEKEFDGVVELGAALASSDRVEQCVARQWFRFAMGRGETAVDDCSMQLIDQRFADADYNLQELVLAITQTPSFRFIHTQETP
ncbi:MAG TPA: DUF1592 domain-containing protein [Polyangiaceae bacterium]|nr:DUF1592 domain-containing protein [Polyangiaceae bacterium]